MKKQKILENAYNALTFQNMQFIIVPNIVKLILMKQYHTMKNIIIVKIIFPKIIYFNHIAKTVQKIYVNYVKMNVKKTSIMSKNLSI